MNSLQRQLLISAIALAIMDKPTTYEEIGRREDKPKKLTKAQKKAAKKQRRNGRSDNQ